MRTAVQKFFCSLRSQIILTSNFKFVLLPLFAFIDCLNCMPKFGQLILGKIIKSVATRCYIVRLKCTRFDFGCGSIHPRPRWESSQRSLRPFGWIWGVLLLTKSEGEKEGRGKRKEKRGRRKEGREKGKKQGKSNPLCERNFWLRPCC